MTKEVIVTAPKPGLKIANAGRAPVLIAAEEAEAARKTAEAEPAKITPELEIEWRSEDVSDEVREGLTAAHEAGLELADAEAQDEAQRLKDEAEQEEAERAAVVAKREADEAEAEKVEADRKAAETETERAAAEAARVSAEREEAERKAAKAKPADTILSLLPPPPAAAEPAPTSVSTEQLNEYVGSLNAEQAKREADEAAAAAKAVSAAAVTGDMPAVTDPPPPSAAPESSQRVKRDPAVAMPAVTKRQVWLRQNWPQIVFGTIAVLFAIGMSIAVGCVLYYGVDQIWSSPVTSTEPPHPTTVPANDRPSVAMPLVTTAIPIPNPEPVPHGLLPPPAPARNEQEGLRGAHGARVRMPARDAFPVSCATAWGARRTDGVLFLCAHGQRRGNNLCDCDVTGTVP